MSYSGQKNIRHGFVIIAGMPRTNIGIMMCAVNMGLAWKKNWVTENNWYSGDYYGETMKIAREVKITLVMTPDEALFLKSLVQNPNCPPDEEPEDNRKMRKMFWDILSEKI
jgi:hypothetical protein